jgi:hypothetical protein
MNKVRLLLILLLLFMSLAGKGERNTNVELYVKDKAICSIFVFMNSFDEQHFIMLDDHHHQWLFAETHLFLEGLV